MQILPFAAEGKDEEVLIRLELFLEVYGSYVEETREDKRLENIRNDLYWYVSDYSEDSVLARTVYILVAISAVWCISLLFRKEEALSYQRSDH